MNNDDINVVSSFKFLAQPQKIAEEFNFNLDDKVINKVSEFMKELSDEEVKSFVPVVVQKFIEYKTEYKPVFDVLKSQVKKEQEVADRSISPDELFQYLQMIRDNWQSVALIVIALRTLGGNKIKFKNSSIETESIFEDIGEIISKATDESDDE